MRPLQSPLWKLHGFTLPRIRFRGPNGSLSNYWFQPAAWYGFPHQLPRPRPSSLARMMAWARSATWSLLKMLET